MKKRIIFSLIITIIVGFVVMAMITTPYSYKKIVYNSQDVLKVLSFEEAVESTGNSITYHVDELPSHNLIIKFEYELQGYTLLRVSMYNDSSDEYVEKINIPVQEGTQYAAVELPDGDYNKITIAIEQGLLVYSQAEFHRDKPVYTTEKVYPSISRVIIASLIIVVAFIISYMADGKLCLHDKITDKIKSHYRFGLLTCAYICASIVVSAIIEVIIKAVTGTDEFNIQRFVYIEAVLLLVGLMVLLRNSVIEKPEKIVSIFILIMGLTMIFTTVPSYNSWDTNSHYEWALSASSFGKAYVTQADLDFCYIYDEVAVKNNRQDNVNAMITFERDKNWLGGIYRDELSLAHYPAGIAIAITRFLRMPFYWIFKSGQVANIILYSLLCYFGMKKLVSGKMIYAVIAMIPTNIFLASSYSYDYWVTAFSMLGMSYFIGNCQRRDEYISTKDTVIMVGALALACIPKQIYILFLLIPFLMPKNKIKNKKKYYMICCCGLLFMATSLFVRTIADTTGTGDTRGGADVNPMGQIKYIFTNLYEYIRRLIKYSFEYMSIENTADYMISFAFMGYGHFGSVIITLLMLFVAITDKKPEDYYKNMTLVRIYAISMFYITILFMITALYISFTPVGSLQFNGCQARYIVPLLYPLMSTIGSAGWYNNSNRKWYNTIVIAFMTVITMSGIYACMLTKML